MILRKRGQVMILSDEIQKVPINEQKLNQMINLIISAERRNIKTREFTTRDMVNAVRRIIEKYAE